MPDNTTPIIVGNLLYFADKMVMEFVSERMPIVSRGPLEKYSSIGVIKGGKLVAGVVFHNFRSHDIEMSGAIDVKNFATPRMIAELFAYPFLQLGVARITTITSKKNKLARKFDEALGFKLEGVLRRGYDGVNDAMIYGILRHECFWLKRLEKKHELRQQFTTAPAAA